MTITRREALVLCAAPALAQVRPKVAITMDDVWWQKIPENRRAESEERLLSSLAKTRAFLFAIGQAVDNEHGARILDLWSSAGHRIGNHTYSHIPLSGSTTPEDFEAGILRTEKILRRHAGFREMVSVPRTQGREHPRDARSFARISSHCMVTATAQSQLTLRIGITISVFSNEFRLNPSFDVNRYRQPYLQHIWDRAQYYDSLAREVLGHSISHTILIHYNLLNALFLRISWRCFDPRDGASSTPKKPSRIRSSSASPIPPRRARA